MDGCTYGHLRPTLLRRLGVDLKMETKHPIGGPFGREFSAFVITAELRRPEVARPGNFLAMLAFLKRPLMVKFSKVCTESFYCLTDRHCCIQI